jgi:hypothetical protein
MNGNKLNFIKLGALWNSRNKDKFGRTFMQGTVEADLQLRKGDKIFVFQAQSRNKSTSPVANVSIGQQAIEEVPEQVEVEQGPAPWDDGQDVPAEGDHKKEPEVPEDCPF